MITLLIRRWLFAAAASENLALPIILLLSGFCLQAQTFNRYTAEQLPLAPKARGYIATIEHRALILNSKAFPVLADALKEQDAAKLKRFLSPSFEASVLHPKDARLVRTERLEVHRAARHDGTACPIRTDAEGFANYLLKLRQQYGERPKVKFSLMSLAPNKDRKFASAGWRGSLLLELRGQRKDGSSGENISTMEFELAEVPELEVISTAGKWIQSVRVLDIQQAVARQPLFEEVAKKRGIDPEKFTDTWTIFPPGARPIVTGGVYLSDINNDDLHDILVTDNKGIFWYRGLPQGGFEDVTERMGLPGDFSAFPNAAFGDFDNDGYVDLLLDYRAFRNEQGQRFVEVTSGLRFGTATGLTVVDYDRDGLLDLYVTRSYGLNVPRNATNSWIDGPGGPGNQLWRNLGDWQFQEVTREANAAAGQLSCFTAAWLDANNDGWPDAYAINEFGGGILLVNTGKGSFQAQPLVDDVGDFGSMGLAVADYNNDGWIDIYTANMYSKSGRRVMENLPEGCYEPKILAKMKRFVTGSEMYRNQGQLQFRRQGNPLRVHRVGWAYGPAFIDLDNDGFLDLYGTAGFASVNRDEPDG